MEIYPFDLDPRLEQISCQLSDEFMFDRKWWVPITNPELVYLFRKKSILRVGRKTEGSPIYQELQTGSWKYVATNTICIELIEGIWVFQRGFVDDYVLVLRKTEGNECIVFVECDKFKEGINTLERVKALLESCIEAGPLEELI